MSSSPFRLYVADFKRWKLPFRLYAADSERWKLPFRLYAADSERWKLPFRLYMAGHNGQKPLWGYIFHSLMRFIREEPRVPETSPISMKLVMFCWAISTQSSTTQLPSNCSGSDCSTWRTSTSKPLAILQILGILLAIYAVRILLDFIRQEPSATPR